MNVLILPLGTPGKISSCALLLLVTATSLSAQRFAITNITAPNATSLSVASMNVHGQVAGYCLTASSEQRAFFWDNGTSTDLGTLGGSTSVGNALNNFGQVVGYSSSIGDTEYHGFLGIGQTLFDLGTLGGTVSSASAISDAGHVTGYSHISGVSVDYHAFLKPNNGSMLDLGTLGGGTSSGAAVNNLGHVAGDSALPGDFANHAFLHNGVMRDLGTLGGSYSSAAALNDNGWVTGESTLADESQTHAFLYNGTTLLDLGTLGGTYSSGYAINDSGVVIGDSALAGDSDYHGFIFRNSVLTDLGTLGGGFSSSWMINNASQVVGVSANSAGQRHAFVWANGVMVDLNSVLPAGSGWELTGAYFINDNGQIAGDGLYQGQPSWYLLTPRPENHPPVAQAGADQNLSTASTAASVTLDGSASSDPDGDPLSFAWLEGATQLGATAVLTISLPVGTHNLTLHVTDGQGGSADDDVVVTVVSTGDTVPPVVACPGNRTLAAGERGQAAIPDLLVGLVATDNVTPSEALIRTQTPAPGTLVGFGTVYVFLTVADAAGNSTTCSVGVTVADTTPPVVHGIEPITRHARNNGTAEVPDLSLRVRAHDNITPTNQLVITQQPAAGTAVGLGEHAIHVTVTDLAGNATTITVLLRVVDVTAPRLRSLQASPDRLTPVNGAMVPVTLTAVVTDNCDPHPRCRIVSVTSSEAVTGPGDNTAPDWEITGDMTLRLRAEVAGKNCGRVYTVRVACIDASGNTSYRNELVHVPKAPAATQPQKVSLKK
jgi:probable HAF family extracellular repeat protein